MPDELGFDTVVSILGGEDGMNIYTDGDYLLAQSTNPVNGATEVSTLLGHWSDYEPSLKPEEKLYTVHTLYCNGGALHETCPDMGRATKLYTRRLISGIHQTNVESSPLKKPSHVILVGLIARTDDGSIRHEIYSDPFPCESLHGEPNPNIA